MLGYCFEGLRHWQQRDLLLKGGRKKKRVKISIPILHLEHASTSQNTDILKFEKWRF
jgi:hypothetical protein